MQNIDMEPVRKVTYEELRKATSMGLFDTPRGIIELIPRMYATRTDPKTGAGKGSMSDTDYEVLKEKMCAYTGSAVYSHHTKLRFPEFCVDAYDFVNDVLSIQLMFKTLEFEGWQGATIPVFAATFENEDELPSIYMPMIKYGGSFMAAITVSREFDAKDEDYPIPEGIPQVTLLASNEMPIIVGKAFAILHEERGTRG